MKLKVKALDLLDKHMISCFIQDSITKIEWINYEKKVFEIFINRFCWELFSKNKDCSFRVNSVLSFKNTEEIKFTKNFTKINNFNVLLGFVCLNDNEIEIIFSDDCFIKLKGENIVVELEDITNNWYSDLRKIHKLTD